MDDKLAALKDSLIEQFKGKARIEDLVEVIDEEFREIFDFFRQLRDERDLYHAVGKQLDGVGDIAVLTRKEAGQLAGDPVPIKVIEDETYRHFLVYKILKNTCDCTYPDIIKAFRMFWDKPLYYSEDPDYPATMIFDTGDLPGGTDTSPLFTTPLIKPAGVTLKLVARTTEAMPQVTLHLFSGLGYAVTVTELPFLERDIKYEGKVYLGCGIQSHDSTGLPALEREIDYGGKVYIGSGVQSHNSTGLPVVERSISYRAKAKSGSVVQSITQTPIGGVTIQS